MTIWEFSDNLRFSDWEFSTNLRIPRPAASTVGKLDDERLAGSRQCPRIEDAENCQNCLFESWWWLITTDHNYHEPCWWRDYDHPSCHHHHHDDYHSHQNHLLTWLSAHTCPYSHFHFYVSDIFHFHFSHLIICSHLSLLSILANPTPRDCWFVSRRIRVDTTYRDCDHNEKMIVMMVCVSENSLSWGCESWWQRWRCPSNLSIRREHGLEVALLHRVGQIRNVEVRRVLLRLSGHLSLGQNWLYKRKNIKRTIFKYLPVCPDPVTRAQQLTLTWETQSRQSHIPASHIIILSMIIILSYPCRYCILPYYPMIGILPCD